MLLTARLIAVMALTLLSASCHDSSSRTELRVSEDEPLDVKHEKARKVVAILLTNDTNEE